MPKSALHKTIIKTYKEKMREKRLREDYIVNSFLAWNCSCTQNEVNQALKGVSKIVDNTIVKEVA